MALSPITLYFDANPGGASLVIPSTAPAGSGQNIKVLNYALGLENLEVNLYSQVLARLTTGGTDQLGNAINGIGLDTGQRDVQIVQRLVSVETDHRAFLRTTLGYGQTSDWATQAGLIFNFNINSLDRAGAMNLLYKAELNGVSAYLGSVAKFADKTYIPQAASIQAVEARNAATVAAVINYLGLNSGTKYSTAPLATDGIATPIGATGYGIDKPVLPDNILYLTDTVPTDLLPVSVGGAPPGTVGGVSGPNGFIFTQTS